MSRDKKKSRWPITCQNHWHLEETDDLGPTLLTGAGLIWRINKKIDVRSRTFKRSVVVWYCWWNTSGKNQLIADMQFIPLFTGSVHPRWCRTSSINSKDRKERKSEFMWSIPNDISWTLWRWRGLKKTWFVKNDFKKKKKRFQLFYKMVGFLRFSRDLRLTTIPRSILLSITQSWVFLHSMFAPATSQKWKFENESPVYIWHKIWTKIEKKNKNTSNILMTTPQIL